MNLVLIAVVTLLYVLSVWLAYSTIVYFKLIPFNTFFLSVIFFSIVFSVCVGTFAFVMLIYIIFTEMLMRLKKINI